MNKLNSQGIIILGTARDDSNTVRAIKENEQFRNFEIVELHKLKIEPYSYNNPGSDDFLEIVEKMKLADVIVFATPVYWYAMSGVLKTFFDRLTDLVTTSKPLGRALAGKNTYLFSTGTDETLPDGFEVPFFKTSEYFSMQYQDAIYVCVRKIV